MPRWARRLLVIGVTVYLCIGVSFGTLPLLFGAWKVFLIMLVAWPLIFLR